MKITEIDASLYCSHCHDETLHHVQYLNGKIQCIKCTNCQRKMVTDLNPMRELSKEIFKRVTSKPTNLTREYREDFNKFIHEMPKRVISKPFRLIRYANETKKALKISKDL
ncbi:bh protein [Bacillus sp. ISL-46]|uniref:bh protein n=1 Tax=Bacillus sp. ISL-46 TaxID=2819129 RepID=UPI001BE6F4B4|nr:bh protein [Bacillus sp. ISL-46]MBT2722830.1 bh protein [Bacillus sp. ISL-46]